MADGHLKEIFAKNLNNLLSRNHLTQKEFAELINEKQQTVNSWCTGYALPRMGKIQTIADFFKIKKSELLEELTQDKIESLDEQKLLDSYRKLTDDQKEKVKHYIDSLSEANRINEDNQKVIALIRYLSKVIINTKPILSSPLDEEDEETKNLLREIGMSVNEISDLGSLIMNNENDDLN